MRCELVVFVLAMALSSVHCRSRLLHLKAQIANCTSSFICNIGPLGPTCAMECVSRDVLCDGTRDCSTGADELDCPEPDVSPCDVGQFICADNVTCVAADQMCDGTDHCPEGEDETDCPAGCKCQPGSYLCENGEQCIPIASFCDGVIDCNGTADDEPGKCACTSSDEDSPLACGPELPNVVGKGQRYRAFEETDHEKILFHSNELDYEDCADMCMEVETCGAVVTYVDKNDVLHCYLMTEAALDEYDTAFDEDVMPGDADCGTQFYPITCA